jgi:signal transduction histidine kinase
MLQAVTAAIAHDLNQPLMAISASAGAALRRLRCDPPELDAVEALLHDILAQSQRAGRTVAAWQACGQQGQHLSAEALHAAVQDVLAAHAARAPGASR